MPWTGTSFHKHNLGLSPAQSAHAALIANHVLKTTGDEGESIATANKYEQHHRDAGGVVPQQQGGIAGAPPDPQNQNPVVSSLIQRFASMPVDQLSQLAQRMQGSPQGEIINRLLLQKRMVPQQQPGAMHPTPQMQASGGSVRRDMGGTMSGAAPWFTRQEARQDAREPSLGFLHGPTPGRADAIDTTAPAGSHVIPADVVAGLGQGNSLAGAARMQSVIRSGPGGMPLSGGRSGHGPPRPPAEHFQAKGGEVDDEEPENTPVKLSHGEFVVPVEAVRAWGRGSRKRGHEEWDKWIVAQRKKQIKTLSNLPGPVKS